RFRDMRPLDDRQAAALIARDGIDILVDLALHSVGSHLRVFAYRPAPIQMTWLGYVGTTGVDTIRYRITDPYVDPPGTALDVYSEKRSEEHTSELQSREKLVCRRLLE